jgi:hypothetical protein
VAPHNASLQDVVRRGVRDFLVARLTPEGSAELIAVQGNLNGWLPQDE